MADQSQHQSQEKANNVSTPSSTPPVPEGNAVLLVHSPPLGLSTMPQSRSQSPHHPTPLVLHFHQTEGPYTHEELQFGGWPCTHLQDVQADGIYSKAILYVILPLR